MTKKKVGYVAIWGKDFALTRVYAKRKCLSNLLERQGKWHHMYREAVICEVFVELPEVSE